VKRTPIPTGRDLRIGFDRLIESIGQDCDKRMDAIVELFNAMEMGSGEFRW
jgi:hypothetical protein